MRYLFAAAVALMPGVASAQSVAENEQPPIQIGIGVGGLSMADVDISLHGSWGFPEIRLTVPWSPGLAVEVVAGVTRRHVEQLYYDSEGGKVLRSSHLEGPYTLHIRHKVGRPERGFQAFVTYGATGHFDFITYAPETYLTFGDRTVSVNDWPTREIIPPIATTVGLSVERQLGRRFALRGDAQLLAVLIFPFGARASVTASIPLGRFP
jgi:hypothetical protein